MRSSAQRRARNVRAFTLIELTVVLLIIATFTALVVPSVAQAMRAKDIDATAAKLCETLQFAYASAVARRQPVTVRFDPDTRRCRVMLRMVALPWLETTPDRPGARTLTAMSWPEEMQLTVSDTVSAVRGAQPSSAAPHSSTGPQLIRFRSNGRTEDVVIEVADRENQHRYVEIVGLTGEVRVKERLEE
ncbi:MAG: Tfp pilus assembly protein FimT/FimU [Candidatus Brocadiia bacterium]